MNTKVHEPPTADQPGDAPARTRRLRSRLVPVVAVVAAFVAGLVLTRMSGGSPSGATVDLPADVSAATAPATVEVGEGAGADVPAPADATSPEGAVAGFLTAEADGDYEASYAYLAAEDRATNRSPRFWTSRHAHIAPVLGYRVIDTQEQPDGSVAVATELRFRSALDPVVGLVPARASGLWIAVPEGDTWRVAFERSTLEARYPDEQDAVAAARSWVKSVQACDDGVSVPMYGTPDLAGGLCGADGPVELGQPRGLGTDASISGLISAFGPEAASWARVVPVDAPVALGLVLAPVDDRWVVTAVVPGRSDP